MFFVENRKHFFRPFSGKYREQVMECLRGLYTRLYGDQVDYSQAFTQEQLLEVFQEVITRTLVLDEDEDAGFIAPIKSEREQALWIRSLLLDHGWIERRPDETIMQSTYGFSRIGRLFTQPMVETADKGFRTRHRNTRNTRNALQSFIERGDVYDLLDAYEYSGRIISDFSDVIDELEEKKRQLVREVESQQLIQQASDDFFDFMEHRFMPDLAVRLSDDSVEKHRDAIQQLLKKARRKPIEFKTQAEAELRKMAPELRPANNGSVYLRILNRIDDRMHNASEKMLPALRLALHSFTRRADIIIRQLSYNRYGDQGGLPHLCQHFSEMGEQEKLEKLQAMAHAMPGLSLGFVNPSQLKLRGTTPKRVLNTRVEGDSAVDKEARKSIFVQQVLEKAFQVNSQEQMRYILDALQQGHRINSKYLPINNARELLMAAHAIEIASASIESSEFLFNVQYIHQAEPHKTEYYDESDEFYIELVDR